MNHHTPASLISVSSTLLRPTYRTYTEDELHDYAKVLNLLPYEGLKDGVAQALICQKLGLAGLHLEEKQLSGMLAELHQLDMIKRHNLGDGDRPYYMWSRRYRVEDLDGYLAGQKTFQDILHH